MELNKDFDAIRKKLESLIGKLWVVDKIRLSVAASQSCFQ